MVFSKCIFNLIAWFVFCLFVFKCFIYRQMKSPAITATMYGGNKTLYLQVIWTYIIVFKIWIYINLLNLKENIFPFFFNLQTVASIEERTRPNLSKTLKGIVELSGVDSQVRESQFHPSVWMFSFILHYAVEYASLSFYIQYIFNFTFIFPRYISCLKVKCRQMHRTLQQSNLITAVN